MNTIKTLLASFLIIIITFIFIIDAENILVATLKGINICLNTIIPSLFGFMVISSFIVGSGIHNVIFKPLYIIFRRFTSLSCEEFSILFLSLLGGYPVGAKLLSDIIAYNKNYHEIASKRLPYMYCGSPVFIISIVGISLFGNGKIGLLVYLSNVLSCILFAFFMNMKIPNTPVSPVLKYKLKINGEVFVNAVTSSGHALFTVSLTVILFTILLQIMKTLGVIGFFGDELGNVFASFIEISNITAFSKNNKALLPFISAITSMGGLCIITQVSMLVNGKFNLRSFYLLRIPIAVLSGILCYFLTINTNIPIKTYTDINIISPSEMINPAASISLIIMVLLLILQLCSGENKKTPSD